jgi:hypothetical protein
MNLVDSPDEAAPRYFLRAASVANELGSASGFGYAPVPEQEKNALLH